MAAVPGGVVWSAVVAGRPPVGPFRRFLEGIAQNLAVLMGKRKKKERRKKNHPLDGMERRATLH